MPTVVEITGEPVAVFEFFDLPTWNVLSDKHFKTRASIAKKGVEAGASLVQKFRDAMDDWERELLLTNRAFILIKVFPPKEEISDIHNVCVKHILDGFKQGGAFEDDEWAFIPLVMFMWAGIDEDVQWRMPKRKTRTRKGKQVRTRKARMRRTKIEIHELECLVINDESQTLPLGRRQI